VKSRSFPARIAVTVAYDPANIAFGTLHLGTPEGVPVRSGFACPLIFDVSGPGVFSIVLANEKDEIASLPFEVRGPS
jgi:hypothetical protein